MELAGFIKPNLYVVFLLTGVDQTEVAPLCHFCQLKTEALSIKCTAANQRRSVNTKYLLI